MFVDASWLFEGLVVAAAGAALAFRIRYHRARQDALYGPNLYDRIQAILEPYEGQQLSRDSLVILEAEAATAFRDILTGVGLRPGRWKLRVHADEVLGPVPHVHGPEGEVMDLADFEQRLREGRIQLAND